MADYKVVGVIVDKDGNERDLRSLSPEELDRQCAVWAERFGAEINRYYSVHSPRQRTGSREGGA